KALDQTQDGGHAHAGAAFARRHGEAPEIARAIEAHHEEVLPDSWLDHLVLAADALSGARPGARSGSIETAAQRMRKMEELALTHPGVTEAYAVQAGRELRVFVDCDQVGDEAAREVARGLARNLESDMKFPGQIKVTVLRELRATEVAQR
ncbi:MAG: ribonuclease Y, partial [Bdellovibrionota bacterium]